MSEDEFRRILEESKAKVERASVEFEKSSKEFDRKMNKLLALL